MYKSKRITFKKNPAGITHLDVNTQNWTIVGACASAATITGRAFRLTKRGQRVEYRNGSEYVELNADIERIA